MQTPPKIEVIIPPNIHDPLHLLDPVDAIEYQKQLTSPIKRKKKTKNRNRRKKKKSECESPKSNEKNSSVDNNASIPSIKDDSVVSNELNTTSEKSDIDTSHDEKNLSVREKVLRDMKLELIPESNGRKRRISESHANCKNKIRRMDSMDKIVSPVIPQPGAWKRPPRPIPSGAPRGGARNRCRSQSQSQNDDPSPTEEQAKLLSISNTSDISVTENDATAEEKNLIGLESEEMSTLKVAETKIENPKVTFKKTNIKYQYGNYDRYNGYRNLNEFMDVRLKVFKRNPFLFIDKDVLDIGCNAGHITISVAKDLQPKTITGVDIDPFLICK